MIYYMEEYQMNQDLPELEPKLKKPRKKRKDNRIEKEYFEEIELTDPNGKKIVQNVKITRYRAVGSAPIGNKGIPEVELEED